MYIQSEALIPVNQHLQKDFKIYDLPILFISSQNKQLNYIIFYIVSQILQKKREREKEIFELKG